MGCKVPKVNVIDFETEAIAGRPDYPPKPVGFAYRTPSMKRAHYMAWGHPTGNNCTKKEAELVLNGLYHDDHPLLFHNAKFDVDVAEVHMKAPRLEWDQYHDTLFLLFLHDPHAMSLSLKPAAEHYLDLPPEEQDHLHEWIMRNVRLNGRAPAPTKAGAYIALAPAQVVDPYACGDVDRTLALFEYLYPLVHDAGMGEAYDRECRLLPILLDNEREGIRVDVDRLRSDIALYEAEMYAAEDWLKEELQSPNLNIGSNDQMADALDRAGVITDWAYTPKGKRSVSKDNLPLSKFHNPMVFHVMGYRNRLETCLGTFMRKWLEVAEANEGYIFTSWNQVRQGHGKDKTGTRTGRLSCHPNFQNVPKMWEDKDDGYIHPDDAYEPPLTPLPLLRKYLLPDEGQVWGHSDYNQQELRILSHFENAALCDAYKQNPRMDVHDFVRAEIQRLRGLDLERRAVKILNFGMLYGMGLGKLAVGLHCSVDEARSVKAAQMAAMPGLKQLNADIRHTSKCGHPIETWGGRHYYVEEPKLIGNRVQSFEYKLLNYLIQGSAADCTKEALIRYYEADKEARFLVTVHDELNISIPKGREKQEMDILQDVMRSVEFDIPMLTDGKTGNNWGDLNE